MGRCNNVRHLERVVAPPRFPRLLTLLAGSGVTHADDLERIATLRPATAVMDQRGEHIGGQVAPLAYGVN